MPKYRVQIMMIDCRQVEISSDVELTVSQLANQVHSAAISDYGHYDQVEMKSFETVDTIQRDAEPRLKPNDTCPHCKGSKCEPGTVGIEPCSACQ